MATEDEKPGESVKKDSAPTPESKTAVARWALTLGSVVASAIAVFGVFQSWARMQDDIDKDRRSAATALVEAEATRKATAELNEKQAQHTLDLKILEIRQKQQEAVGDVVSNLLKSPDATPFLGQLTFYDQNPELRQSLLDAVRARMLRPRSEREVIMAFELFGRSGLLALEALVDANRSAVQAVNRHASQEFNSVWSRAASSLSTNDSEHVLAEFGRQLFLFVDKLTDDQQMKGFLITSIVNDIRDGARARGEPTDFRVTHMTAEVLGTPQARDSAATERKHLFFASLNDWARDRIDRGADATEELKAEVTLLPLSVRLLDSLLQNAPANRRFDFSGCYLVGINWASAPRQMGELVNVSSAYLSETDDEATVRRVRPRLLRLRGVRSCIFVPETLVGNARMWVDSLIDSLFVSALGQNNMLDLPLGSERLRPPPP